MKIEFAVTFCNKLVELTDSAFYPVKVSARRFCSCVKFSSKVKYLTSLPTQEAAIHCMVVSLPQTCHTPSFQWPRGQTLKQQFRNGVSEPTIGLVQFSQDIFLIVPLLHMKHVASMATMLTPSFPLVNGVGILMWAKAL